MIGAVASHTSITSVATVMKAAMALTRRAPWLGSMPARIGRAIATG
jgi:hypothetical protein